MAAKTIVAMKIGTNFIVPDEVSSLVNSAVIFKLCSTIFNYKVTLKLISHIRYSSILHNLLYIIIIYSIQYNTCHLNKRQQIFA